MKKAATWARTKFSWMKPAHIIPIIEAIQKDARKDIFYGIDLASGKDESVYVDIYGKPVKFRKCEPNSNWVCETQQRIK